MTHKAETRQVSKMRHALRQAEKHLPCFLPPLLALTDAARGADPIMMASVLPERAGLVYRHFGHPDRINIAVRLSKMMRKRHQVLLIGNDPGLAAHVNADGVHWAERDIWRARRWRSRFAVMTAAAHSHKAIETAVTHSIDAVLISTVFASNSPTAAAPMGACRFRKLASGTKLPVYGLGGVNPSNMGEISGHAGLAAVSAFAGLALENS